MRLQGKVAIVTGAAQGIGRAYAQRFAKEGARVVVADIAYEQADATAAEIRSAGGEAVPLKVDVSDETSTIGMAQFAAEQYGGIDILVNNAALYVALLPKKRFTEIPVAELDQVMAVNVRGMFLCCRAVFPYMKDRGKGKIINISSAAIWQGTTDMLHYVTSKGAVLGFTRQLARDMGADGINVNCVTPGFTHSGEATHQFYSPEQLDAVAKGRCIKRKEMPDDLVGAVVFLASDDSDFITGQTINVDGGATFH